MNKKLIFRIIGAISSALIIISVFVPFVSVTGYSSSLWETYNALDTLYLPIMIIVFGFIGVLLFALGFKTEFAYTSVGAIVFFMVMQTIDIINQGTFETLGVGYYFLFIGAIATGVMAFLYNLKDNSKELGRETVALPIENDSVLNQIDKLYDNNSVTDNKIKEESAINPIPVQPATGSVTESPQPEEGMTPVIEPLYNSQPLGDSQPVNPVIDSSSVEIVQPTTGSVTESPQPEEGMTPVIEPLLNLQPLGDGQSVNPVVQDFNEPSNKMNDLRNEISNLDLPKFEEPDIYSKTEEKPLSNPVLDQFNNPSSEEPTSTNNAVDIFGQPMNK